MQIFLSISAQKIHMYIIIIFVLSVHTALYVSKIFFSFHYWIYSIYFVNVILTFAVDKIMFIWIKVTEIKWHGTATRQIQQRYNHRIVSVWTGNVCKLVHWSILWLFDSVVFAYVVLVSFLHSISCHAVVVSSNYIM